MSGKSVSTSNLSKVYANSSEVKALKDVSLDISKGELFTLLGPNGAGKTTFLRIITTQLMPSNGEASVLGFDVVEEASRVREHIAVVPQDAMTYGNLTPWEYCYYFARLRGVNSGEARKVAEGALKTVGLFELKDRMCQTLSGGERRRALISSALSSDADVLMLDEPTSGLDALAKRTVWSALRTMVEKGKTILLTTHMMEEAEMISDKLAIINKGGIVTTGTLEQTRALVQEKFRVVIRGHCPRLSSFGEFAHLGDRNIVYVKSQDEALQVLEEALKVNLRAEVSPISLEDIFIKLVGEANGSESA